METEVIQKKYVQMSATLRLFLFKPAMKPELYCICESLKEFL